MIDNLEYLNNQSFFKIFNSISRQARAYLNVTSIDIFTDSKVINRIYNFLCLKL